MEPRLLIASPQMRDPFFERSLVLLWHHDEDGAMGVIINRTASQTLPDVFEPPDGIDLSPYDTSLVSWGGPVEGNAGTVIFRGEVDDEEGWNLSDGIAVSRSMDVLLRLIRNRDAFLLCLGYAGWGAGQLDEEIVQGGWLWTDVDVGLVLDVPPDERYDRALATLGLNRTNVWMQPIDE